MFVYKKIIVGSIVEVQLKNSVMLGTVEFLSHSKNRVIVAVRGEDGRLVYAPIDDCKLYRVCIAQELYDVYGAIDKRGVFA